jgi:hypothetical protein
VLLIDFKSVISTFRSSVSLRLLTASLIRSSIFYVFSFNFVSIDKINYCFCLYFWRTS